MFLFLQCFVCSLILIYKSKVFVTGMISMARNDASYSFRWQSDLSWHTNNKGTIGIVSNVKDYK